MATYKGIQGYSVQKLSSDPTASEAAGQLWYNSTSGAFKIAIAGAGAWASGGNLNTGRTNVAGIGIITAAVCATGQDAPTTITAVTEEYNGTAWTEVTNIPTATKFPGSGGTQTAGWVAGGTNSPTGASPFPTTMYTYDGTSWATGGAINTGRYGDAGAGTLTTAFICGGAIPPGSPGGVGNMETYNGSAWTEVGNTNTVRYSGVASGDNTAGLIASGHSSGSLTADTEIWNGSSWSQTNDLNMARQRSAKGGGTATSTSAFIAAGYQETSFPPYETTNAESWNGTSWTETTNLTTARAGLGGATSGNTSFLAFGGDSPSTSYKNETEEWTDPVYANKTVTVS